MSLGNKAAYELMVAFCGVLLVRGIGIAVKQMGTPVSLTVKLYGFGIRELRAIIRQAYFKDFHEPVRAQFQIEPFKDIHDGLGIVMIPQESKHQFRLDEMDGEKDFCAADTLHGIKLGNRSVRECFQKGKKIVIAAADTAGFVHLHGDSLFSGTVPYLPWKIHVHGRDGSGINKPVDGPFTDHEGILVGGTDMMRRLVPLDQRGYELIQEEYLFLGERKSGSGFRERVPVFPVCFLCLIEALFKTAGGTFTTSVADIGRFIKPWAGINLKIFAESIAHGTASAEGESSLGMALCTDAAFGTIKAVDTGIVIQVHAANTPEDEVCADFLGDGGGALLQSSADL